MELRHLRYFVTVAEELNFGRAATRLNMSQPPLSQQIQQLEADMGVPLFYRTNRKVELTDAGKVFLEKAYKILREVEKARDHTRKAYLGEYGKLAIGFTGSTLYDLIPLLKSYRAKYPLVDVLLYQKGTVDQLLDLHEERIHIGLICTPIERNNLNIAVIRRQQFVAVLPTTHPLAAENRPIDIEELADETFIMPPREVGSAYYDTIMDIFHKVGFIPKVTTAHVSISVAPLVSTGLGITLVPHSLQNLPVNGVVYKELTNTTSMIETAVAWRQNDRSPVVDMFLSLVGDYYKTTVR